MPFQEYIILQATRVLWKPDNWESFADDIGDDGCEEEVCGKQVDKAEHQHLQLHIKRKTNKKKH